MQRRLTPLVGARGAKNLAVSAVIGFAREVVIGVCRKSYDPVYGDGAVGVLIIFCTGRKGYA